MVLMGKSELKQLTDENRRATPWAYRGRSSKDIRGSEGSPGQDRRGERSRQAQSLSSKEGYCWLSSRSHFPINVKTAVDEQLIDHSASLGS